MNMKSLMKIAGNPAASIFLDSKLCKGRSKAFVISIAHVNTSDAFFKMKSTVSSTAQVHIVVEQPA